MSIRPGSRGARTAVAAVLACASLVLGGCGAARDTAAPSAASVAASGSTSSAPSQTPSPSTSTSTTAPDNQGQADSVPAPAVTAAAVADNLRPTRITIASIGVDSFLVDLGIAGDGTIQVPTDPAQAGWLGTSPAPGQQGPAVIAGHVDSKTGPAVFYQLRTLTVGAPIVVTRRDGSQVTFTVDGLQSFSKSNFPTQATYGPVPGPALRLITCGGQYVKAAGGYQDNLVVFAS